MCHEHVRVSICNGVLIYINIECTSYVPSAQVVYLCTFYSMARLRRRCNSFSNFPPSSVFACVAKWCFYLYACTSQACAFPAQVRRTSELVDSARQCRPRIIVRSRDRSKNAIAIVLGWVVEGRKQWRHSNCSGGRCSGENVGGSDGGGTGDMVEEWEARAGS